MIVIRVISVTFIIAGALLLWGGARAFRNRRDFIASAQPARGVVTGVERRRPRTRTTGFAVTYYFRVRYETAVGQTVEFVTAEGHSSPEYKVGDLVPVLYTGDGRAAINSFSMLWFNSAFLFVSGGCFLGAG